MGRCFRFNEIARLLFDGAKRLPAASIFLIAVCGPCYALSAAGVPGWMEPAVIRSLNAVWAEIPNAPDVDREGTLELVASRLFAGYDVTVSDDASGSSRGPCVSFVSHGATAWNVRLAVPELRDMARSWFEADVLGMEEELLALLDAVPVEALTWADDALKNAIKSVSDRRLPGWDFSVQAALGGSGADLTVSFRPRPPLVLAMRPSLYSGTMPAMFQSDLEAKLAAGLSPLIGLPVEWAARHKFDVEEAARVFLEDRHTVENMKAEVKAVFEPGPMSRLDASVDSDRFRFKVWVAAYAGLEGRYPEAGIFLGWNTARLTGIALELYAEATAELDDFETKRRLGGRIELFDNFMVGAEVEWPKDLLFWRVQWGPRRVRRPYIWWRWNHDAGHEGALGYRVDEHISIELFYDGTGSDKIGLRGLWAL